MCIHVHQNNTEVEFPIRKDPLVFSVSFFVCVSIQNLLVNSQLSTYSTCELRLLLKARQRNKPESPLFYFHRKKAAQVGFKPTTSRLQGSCPTN